MTSHLLVRNEETKDIAAVHALNASAFDSPVEAELVDTLRRQANPIVSIVAEDGGTIVGHIMFSPVSLSGHPELKIMGLAPMAVKPTHQNKGVGAALVRAGLERCKDVGYGAVVVLGHPGYYPRFGFSPSTRFCIVCEFEAPQDAFMITELEPGYLRGKSGIINYHAAFH